MRSIRVVGVGKSYYHCISRVVDRRIVFRAGEKEVFRSILRKLEDFCDVRVVTYCLMGNHFHLLLEIPEEGSLEPLTSAEWLERLPLLYDRATVAMVADELERASRAGDTHGEKTILDRYERRRGHLSIFLKELKQRVSIFMNRRLGRVGTLWEGRFKSVLVDGGGNALLTVAAYIDLNPVRAGLVKRSVALAKPSGPGAGSPWFSGRDWKTRARPAIGRRPWAATVVSSTPMASSKKPTSLPARCRVEAFPRKSQNGSSPRKRR
jgi:hypothetical protein